MTDDRSTGMRMDIAGYWWMMDLLKCGRISLDIAENRRIFFFKKTWKNRRISDNPKSTLISPNNIRHPNAMCVGRYLISGLYRISEYYIGYLITMVNVGYRIGSNIHPDIGIQYSHQDSQTLLCHLSSWGPIRSPWAPRYLFKSSFNESSGPQPSHWFPPHCRWAARSYNTALIETNN